MPAKAFRWFLALAVLIYAGGLFVDIMQVDAAQYASISREMMETGQWLQVHHRYTDYLDKPPLLFWLSALSLKIFGVHVWAFKLPTVLFAFAGFYGLFKLTQRLYNPDAGRLAVLILASCLGWVMFNNDVRTDSLLASNVILSTWLLQEYRERERWKYLFGGFFFAALAMLAKGPIGLAVPGIALGADMIIKGQWKQIFDWRWIVGLIFLVIILSPMLYGLYKQYDAHPEKGISGLKFFFWTQSFGRITGENTWHNDSSPSLFFVHTYLWSFAPWSVLLLPAFWNKTMQRIKGNHTTEYLGIPGFLIPFIVLSFSHYKLPHYIYVIFPFAALLLGGWLASDKPVPKFFALLQWIINILFWIAAGAMAFYFFPLSNVSKYLILAIWLAVFIWITIKTAGKQQLVYGTVITALFIGFYYNFFLSPGLMQWPADSRISEKVMSLNAGDNFFDYKIGSHVIDFKLNRVVPYIYSPQQVDSVLIKRPAIWLYTDEDGYHQLQSEGYRIMATDIFTHFGVNEMSWEFINPKTRNTVLRRMFLIELGKKPL